MLRAWSSSSGSGGGAGTQATFSTVAQLRANTRSFSSNGGLISLQGWAAPVDGGEGTFEYDPTDTTTADDGGTVFVDAAGQRIKRKGVAADKIYAAWFNVIPAGDSNGNHQVARDSQFANALAAARSRRAVLQLPFCPGATVILFTQPLVFQDGDRWIGHGGANTGGIDGTGATRGATTIQFTFSADTNWAVHPNTVATPLVFTENVIIEGICFIAGGTSVSGGVATGHGKACLYLDSVRHCSFRDLQFSSWVNYDVVVNGTRDGSGNPAPGDSVDLEFSFCRLFSNCNTANYQSQATGNYSTGNNSGNRVRFYSCEFSNNTTAGIPFVLLSGSQNIHVGSTFQNANIGALCKINSLACYFYGCVFGTTPTYIVDYSGGGHDCAIIGCHIDGPTGVIDSNGILQIINDPSYQNSVYQLTDHPDRLGRRVDIPTFEKGGGPGVFDHDITTSELYYRDFNNIRHSFNKLFKITATPTLATGQATFDLTKGTYQTFTMDANRSFLFTNWEPAGIKSEIELAITNGTAHTITWPTMTWLKFDGTTTPTIPATLAASGTDYIRMWTTDGGTTLFGYLPFRVTG